MSVFMPYEICPWVPTPTEFPSSADTRADLDRTDGPLTEAQ